MSGGNRKHPLKVSGLVASGKVVIRAQTEDAAGAEQQRSSDGVTNAHLTSVLLSSGGQQHDRGGAADTAHERSAEPSDDVSSSGSSGTASSGAGSPIAPANDIKRRIPLALIVDSPYQPRLKYDPEEIDQLADTMRTAAHADPIKVRQRQDGKYELISGHRRTRAARSLGWPEIDAYVEVLSDQQAQKKTMLLAVGNVALCDYELAKMFHQALADKLCETQREVSSFFGIGTTKVNGCLDLLKLPPTIIRFLEAKPDLFSYETGIVIKKLCKEYPDRLAEIERGVKRLTEGATQGSLKAWILQAIKGQTGGTAVEPKHITVGRRLVFTTKIDPEQRTVLVNCKVPMDIIELEKSLQAWLEDQATKLAPTTDEPTGKAVVE